MRPLTRTSGYTGSRDRVLLQLGAGVGNIVLATPLLTALRELGFEVDIALAADYPETAELLRPWNAVRTVFANSDMVPANNYQYVLPAIPPFYWPRFAHRFRKGNNLLSRPSDSLFYQNEQAFYLSFARTLGWDGPAPAVVLPIAPTERADVTGCTLVLAPGCKTGEMAKKRWPYFPQLAEEFGDVFVVGTADDLCNGQGARFHFPTHVVNLTERLSLRETAEVIASAGAFVGNDSGLSHIAAAVGTPTVMIFGPTSERVLGSFPANVHIVRRGLRCEPCWRDERFGACASRIDCLAQITVERVVCALADLGFRASERVFFADSEQPPETRCREDLPQGSLRAD